MDRIQNLFKVAHLLQQGLSCGRVMGHYFIHGMIQKGWIEIMATNETYIWLTSCLIYVLLQKNKCIRFKHSIKEIFYRI